MRRVLAALALCLLITTPALSISDAGRPAISRLWTNQGDKMHCTVSYIFPYIDDDHSWVVTAGHCIEGRFIKRNADVTTIAVVNWRGVLLGKAYTKTTTDIALGTASDTRDQKHEHLWLADTCPEKGLVYIHGFPMGVERITEAKILSPADVEKLKIDKIVAGTRVLEVPYGQIKGGSSGSPVMDESGRVVGILWGLLAVPVKEGYDIALFTPVERIHALLKILDVKP